ncbi:hypothetical protein [Hymenobacter sp. DG25B]|uniref:hypothetical protein n=1 Tax=Hymenobacter sp. DG25B TaxID=1385664 RepID=UPI000B167EEC|nr:hypothetical protein [Hymenobacter sp. DG25B]
MPTALPAPAVSDDFLMLPLAGGRYTVRWQAGSGAAPGLPLAFDPLLFLRPAHLALQPAPSERLLFWLEDQRSQQTVALFPVFGNEKSEHSISPYQAPFGGIQLAESVGAEVLQAFLAVVLGELQTRKMPLLRLKCYPGAYAPAAVPLLAQALTSLGFRAVEAEVNHHLLLAEAFEARLHPSEQRRLRKCQRAGMQFEQEPPLLLPLAYEFLARCRQEKGQALSLPLERLQELFKQFPRDFFLFSVRDAEGNWAALTVAIRLNEQVLYNFYPASPLAYNAFSPVVLLNAGLHAFGRANGMRLLDLGTSMLPAGSPNFPLLRFKEHLGGVMSQKFTFEAAAPQP